MSGRIILTSLVLVLLFSKSARMVLIEVVSLFALIIGQNLNGKTFVSAANLLFGLLTVGIQSGCFSLLWQSEFHSIGILVWILSYLVFSLIFASGLLTCMSSGKHAKKFKAEDTQRDMTGKNCIITGANQGIGYAAAEALASRGATVHLVCRSQAKGEKAVSDIKAKTDNQNVSLEVCDLSSMQQIKDFVAKYASSDQPLHVLVNNAGLMENERVTTADSLEMNFAVNVGGVYALTELLIPVLEKAAPDARVITVSSGGMYTQPLSTFLQYEDQKKMDGSSQYARNKRVQVALTEHWTEVYGSKGIGFYAMHPGWVDTAALQKSMPSFRERAKGSGFLRTTEQGADTTVWLAQQPTAQLQPGGFYFDRTNSSKHLPGFHTSYSPDQVNPLVSAIRSLCGIPSN